MLESKESARIKLGVWGEDVELRAEVLELDRAMLG
jgi:hypothetical protein